jgi:hypothetical protein
MRADVIVILYGIGQFLRKCLGVAGMNIEIPVLQSLVNGLNGGVRVQDVF